MFISFYAPAALNGNADTKFMNQQKSLDCHVATLLAMTDFTKAIYH